MNLRTATLVLACFASLSNLLSAQSGRKLNTKALPASAFKLTSIKVTGTERYQPEEVIAASGLRIGQTASESDFKEASQQLGETGAFDNVAYAFEFSPEGTKLDLQVKDAGQFVPARFDNFVWLSDQELLLQLHARVPLFRRELPLAGSLIDQVSDALQALVLERNVQGRADYLRSGSKDGPIDSIVFTITGLSLHIRNVEFAGSAPAELPLLQAIAKKMQGQDYLRSNLRIQAEKDLLPVYLERGYLKAVFADAQPKVVQATPEATVVDVTFPVSPGQQYRMTEIQLSEYKAFSAEKLRELIHQQLGQPANAIQLDHDLEAIKKLYTTRGYMAAAIQATPEMDDEHSTVKYLLRVSEGDVYKMGDLDIRGLDTHTTARLVNAWKLREGDPYDSSYLQKFLDETTPLLPAGQWNVSPHESVEDKDKTVDVTLRFDLNVSR